MMSGVVRLPRDLIERIDERAADEMRSRSNLVRVLVSEGLRRREASAEDGVESR
jgi:metal-responsive CopG/Arc/MetJ family transcriptional regulator